MRLSHLIVVVGSLAAANRRNKRLRSLGGMPDFVRKRHRRSVRSVECIAADGRSQEGRRQLRGELDPPAHRLQQAATLSAEEKEDYFQHFLERKPVGVIDSSFIEIDCNTAFDAGLYTFRFADGSEVKARYTYTYKWNGEQWLITSHHSSAMPEKN